MRIAAGILAILAGTGFIFALVAFGLRFYVRALLIAAVACACLTVCTLMTRWWPAAAGGAVVCAGCSAGWLWLWRR
jgi:hypothetical protein